MPAMRLRSADPREVRPHRRAALRCALSLCAALAPVTGSAAPGHPLAQHRVATVPPAALGPLHVVPTGPHTLFGTIVAIRNGSLTLRLRSGAFIAVDATAAIRNGDYSAPLFVGKLVIVDGSLRAGRIDAAHVYRVDNLAHVPADR